MQLDKKMLIGFIASIGLFFPLFGQSISILGIHNRLIGFLLLIFSAFLGVRYLKIYKIRKYQAFYFVFVMMLLSLEFLYSDSSQIKNLLILNYNNDSYFINKLTITYFSIFIPFFSLFILSSISLTRNFVEGFIRGFLVLSILVVIVSFNNSEYWFIDDYALKKEYMESGKKFSQINITILHLLGVFYSIRYFYNKKYLYAFPLFLTNSIFIIIYQQRSAWAYLIISFIIFSLSQGTIGKFVKQNFIFVIIGLLIYLVGIEVGVFNDSVLSYGDQALSGELLSSRTESYMIAWDGFLENPVGNGYGSYSIYGIHPYPHNIILECLYELGFFSTMILIIILLFSFTSMLYLFYSTRIYNDSNFLLLSLLIGYLLIIPMKAGDLSTTDLLFSTSLLFMGILNQRKKEIK